MTPIDSAMTQTRRRKNVFIDQQRIDRVKPWPSDKTAEEERVG
jgi:hypothetical protein